MRNVLSATLVAMAAFGFAATGAMADDDDDDKGDDRRRGGECKVLMAEATAESTLIVTGFNLAGSRPIKVWFGGDPVEVLEDPAPTSTQFVVDLSAVLEGVTGPKDFLLEIKRSRRDKACPKHLVTVVSRSDQGMMCPTECATGMISWFQNITVFNPENEVVDCGSGNVSFRADGSSFNPLDTNIELSVIDNSCVAFFDVDSLPTEVFVNLTGLTDEQQAACAMIAETLIAPLSAQQCVP